MVDAIAALRKKITLQSFVQIKDCFKLPAVWPSLLAGLLGVVVVVGVLGNPDHIRPDLCWTEADCRNKVHKSRHNLTLLHGEPCLLLQLSISFLQAFQLRILFLQFSQVQPQHSMDMWSSTVLKFGLVAVAEHTQWTVLGHHYLFDKGFDPLVETSGEAKDVLADVLMSALVCSILKKGLQRHPNSILVLHLNLVLTRIVFRAGVC